MEYACPKCYGRSTVDQTIKASIDTSTGSQPCVRRMKCTKCGWLFLRYEDTLDIAKPIDAHTALGIATSRLTLPDGTVVMEIETPADTTAQPDNEDPLDAKLRALGYNG